MVTALAAAGLSGPVLALDTVWLGGDGNWSDGSKWSLGQPGMADVAILDSGAAVLNFNTIVSGLNLSSALSGTGQLTLTGSSNWSGGTQFGSGVTTYSGRLAITGDDSKIINRLINAGNTTWSGNTAVNTNGLHFNGGWHDEADAALKAVHDWLIHDALPNVPAPFRDSFLQRNLVNRSILARFRDSA